ncbi:TraX family protein [Streptococcus cristatus]
MFLDHIHEMFIEMGAPIWLTMLGRLVFPIFLFLAADSFHYTHDRKAYMKRLLFMSWFMTTGNMIVGSLFKNGDVGLMNNAFSTFFMTGIYICSWDLFVKGLHEKSMREILKAVGLFVLPILLMIPTLLLSSLLTNPTFPPVIIRLIAWVTLLIPNVLLIEGGFLLVVLGLLFYIFRQNRILQIVSLAVISLAFYLMNPADIQWMMVFSAIPIYLYNGEKGQGHKNFFYIFYPLHIYALYILASLLR